MKNKQPQRNGRTIASMILACLIFMAGQPAMAEDIRIEPPENPSAQELTYFGLDEFATEPMENEQPVLPDKPEMLNIQAPSPEETAVSVNPAQAEPNLVSNGSPSARMTIEELRNKFPEGKYWNHASNPGAEPERNNPDGWTDIPCPEHHDDAFEQYAASGINTCNVFYYNGKAIGAQCYGFTAKLAYDATGTCMEDWPKINNATTAMQAVKPGDVLRINQEHHAIYVIAVNETEIMYADCNEGHQCAIHWNTRMTKQEAAGTLNWLAQSPVTVPWGGAGACWCSGDRAGLYNTQTSVQMRSGHGTSYSTIMTVPAGAQVQVTCVAYNGFTENRKKNSR